MTKAAVIIGAILLLAGVATAGTVAGLGSSSDGGPTVSIPAAGTTTGGTTTGRENELRGRENELRGRENELRGRENEPGEDVRGPCDELEHANDPRCTGVTVEDDDVEQQREHRGRGRDDDVAGDDDRSGPSENSGPGSVDSGHSGGGDRGGNSGSGGDDD
jgi:hypothetical protein